MMEPHTMKIRKCTDADIDRMYDIINDAARAYKGIIPDDRWHDPYMPRDELIDEIQNGVVFWGVETSCQFVGVMGIQDKGDVTLIRHSYVCPRAQHQGIGTTLLRHLEAMTDKPILIGTWAHASWAITFYVKNGYSLLTDDQKNRLLKKYWSIPDRQVETSVVLANPAWWIGRKKEQPFANPGEIK